VSAIKAIELKIAKFLQYRRQKGVASAIRVSLSRLFPSFVHNKNVWGLKYALSRLYVNNMPASPFYKKYLRSRITAIPRIQLGAGTTICPNWLHQDVKRFQNRKHKNLDCTINVFRLNKYIASNSLDAIFTSHMIEHLSRNEAKELLGDCYNWLKSGGELWISVPDLSILYDIATAEDTSEEDRENAMMLISSPRPGHVSCWFYEDMKKILESLGFENARRWVTPPKEFQSVAGCWNVTVVGKLISLNIVAIKK
jgi:predicted SAM-dependent methyltransferase